MLGCVIAQALSVDSYFEPVVTVPVWLWLIATCAVVGFATWIYLTERGSASRLTRAALAAIRCALLLIVVWMLCGWNLLAYRTERPGLAIVFDQSLSMATKDMPRSDSEFDSRLDAMKALLESIPNRLRSSIEQNYDVRWYTAGDRLGELDSSNPWLSSLGETAATDTRSALGDSLIQLIERYSGRGAAAVVFLSDGINTAGRSLEEAGKASRSSATPIYTVTLGREFSLPDVRLADLLMEREVYLGDRVSAEVAVLASDVKDTTVKVELVHTGTGKVLDQTDVRLKPNANQASANLSFVPSTDGEIQLEFRVSAVEGEKDEENNRIAQTIQVQNKALRVLLVQEKPSYEFRFLKHFLERSLQLGNASASFELASVLQESDPEYVRQDQSALRLVPSRSEDIDGIDVFIFGPFDPSLVSRRSQQAIFDAVTAGGAGCIFVAPDARSAQSLQGWPIGNLLPIDAQSNSSPLAEDFAPNSSKWQWSLTQLGESFAPVQLGSSTEETYRIWNRLPKLNRLNRIDALKTGAQILVEALSPDRTSPLLVTQYAGAGRVILQATDETYRWTSFQGDDTYHERYWGQLIRWSSRGRLSQRSEQSSISVDPPQARMGQSIRIEARIGTDVSDDLLPTNATVRITSELEGERDVQLSPNIRRQRVYTAEVQDLRPGQYSALLTRPNSASPVKTNFVIKAPPGEQNVLKANLEGMKSLAKQTRGRHYETTDFVKLFENLPKGTVTRLGALPPTSIWNAWWVALSFVLLLTAEWIIRRRVRML